jgi:hypothetical protein
MVEAKIDDARGGGVPEMAAAPAAARDFAPWRAALRTKP